MPQKLLILGARGTLGQALGKAFGADPGYSVTMWDKEDVDLTDREALEGKVRSLGPEIIINAAAYNAVDRCEEEAEEYQKALALNRDVPAFLAGLAKELGFLLVHYSSDYVFDGTLDASRQGCGGGCCGGNCHGGSSAGYAEDAVPNPLSRYGESKLLGEQAVSAAAPRYYLIRLSKLFGLKGTSPESKESFFDKMLALAKDHATVTAVDAEKSAFTYAPDLAQATRELIEAKEPWGTYHLVNTGAATWFGGAREALALAGMRTEVVPVPEDAFPRAAKRPAYSVLANTKRPPLRHYREALREYLAEYNR